MPAAPRNTPEIDRPVAPSAPIGRLPTLQSGSAPDTSKPRIPRRDWFWLVAHPDRFTLLCGRMVPMLDEVPLTAGVNGVMVHFNRETGETTIDTSGLEENLRRKRATPIPWDVDGKGTSYIVEAAPGCWVTRWTKTSPGSEFTALDEPAYLAWIEALQERGILPRPEARHIERYAASIRQDLNHDGTVRDQHRSAQLRAQLAVVENLQVAA